MIKVVDIYDVLYQRVKFTDCPDCDYFKFKEHDTCSNHCQTAKGSNTPVMLKEIPKVKALY